MGIAGASGSPLSLVIGDRTYKVGPLTYADRGEIEQAYIPLARSPLQILDDFLVNVPEDDRKDFDEIRKTHRLNSIGWEPELESQDAWNIFVAGKGPPGQDVDPQMRSFIGVCLRRFQPTITEEQIDKAHSDLTKGQREQLWDIALELGEFAPKSSARPVLTRAGDR